MSAEFYIFFAYGVGALLIFGLIGQGYFVGKKLRTQLEVLKEGE